MKISTTPVFKHSIIAPKGYLFDNQFMDGYRKVLGDDHIEVRQSGNVLTFTEMHINTLDDTNIDWESFMDEHLKPLMIKSK